MKFSADVNHNFVVNWWKDLGCSTTHKSATPLFVSKLCKGLAPILFEIFSKEFFWWGSRPISVTQWQEFQISPKKWRFEIFRTSAVSRGNRVIHAYPNNGFFKMMKKVLTIVRHLVATLCFKLKFVPSPCSWCYNGK